MPEQKIKAIIFDFHGVFYPDTSWQFFHDHKDLFIGDDEFMLQLNNKIDLSQITREQYYQSLAEKTGISVKEIMVEISNRKLNQELVNLIHKLKKQYKIGLLSNAGPHLLDILEAEGITELFDAITASYQAGAMKPDQKIYLKAVEQLAVDATDCVFTDDRFTNLEPAEALGMQTIHYQGFEQFREDLNEILHAGNARSTGSR